MSYQTSANILIKITRTDESATSSAQAHVVSACWIDEVNKILVETLAEAGFKVEAEVVYKTAI